MDQAIAGMRELLQGLRGRQFLVALALVAAAWVLLRAWRGFGALLRMGFAMAWVALWTGSWAWFGR